MKRVMIELFYLSHGVKVGTFKSIVIASPDTEIFVALYTIIENLCTLV